MKIFKNITNGYRKIASGIAIVAFLTLLYFALIPGGTIAASSYVITATGDPVIGAFIKLMDYPQYNATTDGTGQYTMPNVPIGTYNISATAPGYAPNISTVTVATGTNIKNFTLAPAINNYLPFLYQRADNLYDAAVQIQNDGTTAANVEITLYNLDGTTAGTGIFAVQPGAMLTKHAFDIVIGKSIFVGPAVVTSDVPVQAQSYIKTVNEGVYSIAPTSTTPALNSYLPFLYQRADNLYDAGVQVFNPGTSTASVTINMYNLDGTLAGTGTYSVAPQTEVSKYAFDIVTGKSTFVGPAEVISTQPVAVQGFIRTKASNVYSIAPQVRKPVAAGKAHVPFLYQTVSATHDAGIQAMNPNGAAANVNIKLYYPDGSLAGSYSQSVAPFAELSKYAFDIAPVGVDFTGSVVVTADQPIVSQGFIRKKSSNIYSIAPPVER